MNKLDQQHSICVIHADKLKMATEYIASTMPIDADKIASLTKEELLHIEFFTSRLGKLQDTIGEKVFPLLLTAIGEDIDHISYIDRLNQLEKLQILPSTEWWQELRTLRNILLHEYPNDPGFLAKNLNDAYVNSLRFLAFWDDLQAYIIERGLDQPS